MNWKNAIDHPKTTITGLLVCIVTATGVLSQQGVSLGHAGTGTVVALIGALAAAFLGVLARDPAKTVTSGTGPQKLGALALAFLVTLAMLPVSGCTSQTTIAALVTTLGNASASIAQIEGNTSLANQLKADTAAASAAVLNWKKGTPAQSVVEALNLVQNDLALITGSCQAVPGAMISPVCQYVPLIDLAIATTTSIIQIVDPSALPVGMHGTMAKSWKAPRDASQFKKQWNSICAANPKLSGVRM